MVSGGKRSDVYDRKKISLCELRERQMRPEEVVICRIFCVLLLENEFGMINTSKIEIPGAKEIPWIERYMRIILKF